MPRTHRASSARLHGLRRRLAADGCTHLLVSDTVAVRYLTGFASSNAYCLVSSRQALLCTDFRYEQAVEAHCRRNPPWKSVIIREGDFAFLKEHTPAGAVVGIQSDTVTIDQLARLRRSLRGVRFINLGSAVSDIAVVKTPAEIALTARCARMACKALGETLPLLQAGITEREARDCLDEQCRLAGSEGPAFETIALFGRRSALPHGVPSNARLKQGDFVLFDFGCTSDGLRSDITRTFVKGPASQEQRAVYHTVQKAQLLARKGVRAGVACSTVDALARNCIGAAGYGEYFGHATGHGVGYRIHEGPRVSAKNASRLRQGCVVTVEPGIYIPSLGGVRIEDMVCVMRDRARVLTSFPRGLMEI